MQVVRELIYEGDQEGLDKQLARSFGDGVISYSPGVTITIRTLVDDRPETTSVFTSEKAKIEELQKAVDYWRSISQQ